MESVSSTLPAFFNDQHVDINLFSTLCRQQVEQVDYPFAQAVEQNVVIYHGHHMRALLDGATEEQALSAEINRCLNTGPGVLVIREAYPDISLIDRTTKLFYEIIQGEQDGGKNQGDHFGNNERIWNSLQKVCLRDPAMFISYYGDPLLALVSRAWLGPYYQITAQVNNVKSGSSSQSPHRDYHLGFQSNEVVARFPAHIQVMSQFLTLQGAIAHTDMPLVSGPTLFLPFSQQFAAGYLSYRNPAFIAFFEQHHVQLPLNKGDAVYFSPALFHGAGANRSSADRLANLVQISSAFGRPMESINRYAMIDAVYPVLVRKRAVLNERKLRDTIAAVADGYAFPTNLDADPPLGGNAPRTAQHLMHDALIQGLSLEQLKASLSDYANRRQA